MAAVTSSVTVGVRGLSGTLMGNAETQLYSWILVQTKMLKRKYHFIKAVLLGIIPAFLQGDLPL